MTVDELIAALEDAKRLEPTIGGWEVRIEVDVEYEDDNYRLARFDGVATISETPGAVTPHAYSDGPLVIIRPEVTA